MIIMTCVNKKHMIHIIPKQTGTTVHMHSKATLYMYIYAIEFMSLFSNLL